MDLFQAISSYFIQISSGLQVTLQIFIIVLILSVPLGIAVAILRLFKIFVIRKITEIYIWILRGSPLLLQLIFFYFGLAGVGIKLGRTETIVFAFTLNYAAYFGEIFRSGFQSIERGQKEAAQILGFSSWQINKKVVLPQVIKRTLPSIGNEVITLVKDTSLVYILGINDILKITKGIASRDVTLLPYVIAVVFYLVLTYILTKVFERIETRIKYDE